jgi:hypothetical protein
MDNIKNLKEEVNDLIEMEDLKCWQKAKQDWLQFGDKNKIFSCLCEPKKEE